MNRFKLRAVASVVALLFLIAAGKQDTKKLAFLKADSVDPVALLPDPPRDGSAQQQAEIKCVLDVQHASSEVDKHRAKSEEKLSVFAFQDVMGSWFTPENLPLTNELFTKVHSDSKYFSSLAKNHFARPRPARKDSRVVTIIDEVDASYPSGHATRGMLYAILLAQIDPDQHDLLIDRGEQIGWDRIVAGVHYPSDVDAGRVLGTALARALLENAEFCDQLKAAKAEIEHARSAAHIAEPATLPSR